MFKNWWFFSLIIGVCFGCLGGCDSSGSGAKPTGGPTSATAALDASQRTGEGEQEKVDLKWPGLWRVEMTGSGIVHEFGVVNVSEGATPGEYSIKTQALSPSYDAAVLKEGKIEGDQIELIFDGGPELQFIFSGKREGSDVKGSLLIRKLQLSTMRLIKVESDILEGEEGGIPMEGYEVVDKLVRSPEGEDGLRDFIDQYPDNPIILNVFEALAGFAKGRDASLEEIKELHASLVKQAKRWGPLIEARSSFEFARSLARFDCYPDLAREYLSEFEKTLNDDSPSVWAIDLAVTRTLLGNHKEVIAQLKPVIEKNPEDHPARYTLAFAYEKNGDLDAAVAEYLLLAALPFMDSDLDAGLSGSKTESLADSLARVWKAKHGNVDGLSEALDEAYQKGTANLVPPRVDKPNTSDKIRPVLVELFTGTTCPPCVAADLATTALQERYPAPEVIVLRHHLHIPGPDPLTISAGDERFKMYVQNDPLFQQHPEIIGTPSLFANGEVVTRVAGAGVDAVPESYTQLVESIQPVLGRETELKISLEAVKSGDNIQVKSHVEGPELKQDYRLYLLLVENEIHLAAPNGIRIHDGVVRYYINGDTGTAPADKKLEFTGEVVLPEVAGSIRKYQSKMEEKFGRIFAVPAALEKLQIVAFVQDASTREILQAAVVTPESSK